MGRFYYAQIDGTGAVIAVSELHSPVVAADMIPLDVFDASKLGMVWDADDLEFRAP
jgi:hypothetical protein